MVHHVNLQKCSKYLLIFTGFPTCLWRVLEICSPRDARVPGCRYFCSFLSL